MKKRIFGAIDFSRYEGRYVAVVGRRVVASGTNAKQVWLEAKRKYPTARPELHKLPKDETLVLHPAMKKTRAELRGSSAESIVRQMRDERYARRPSMP